MNRTMPVLNNLQAADGRPIDYLDMTHCSLPSAELPVSKIGTASLLIYLVLGIEIRVLVSGVPPTVLEMRHSSGD